MKKVMLFVIMFMITISSYSQTKVIIDPSGNYTTSKPVVEKSKDKLLGKVFTTPSGEKLLIYISANNKHYVYRTSKKTGNVYKQYLKIN